MATIKHENLRWRNKKLIKPEDKKLDAPDTVVRYLILMVGGVAANCR